MLVKKKKTLIFSFVSSSGSFTKSHLVERYVNNHNQKALHHMSLSFQSSTLRISAEGKEGWRKEGEMKEGNWLRELKGSHGIWRDEWKERRGF